MEVRREVYSSIIKVVSCLYTIIGREYFILLIIVFLLFRYSVINVFLVVLYGGFGAKIFEFLNLGATMVGNEIVKRCEYEN